MKPQAPATALQHNGREAIKHIHGSTAMCRAKSSDDVIMAANVPHFDGVNDTAWPISMAHSSAGRAEIFRRSFRAEIMAGAIAVRAVNIYLRIAASSHLLAHAVRIQLKEASGENVGNRRIKRQRSRHSNSIRRPIFGQITTTDGVIAHDS